MIKSICVLLNNAISNDYRVIKTIQTLSKSAKIDLFYIDGDLEKDQEIFNNNVQLHVLEPHSNFRVKLIKHTRFTREFLGFVPLVLKQRVKYDMVWSNDLPTLLPASIIAEKLNAQLVYDSHEIYTETLNQFFPVKTTFFKRIIFQTLLTFMKIHGNKMEKILIQKTNHFITVNDSILDFFKAKYTIKNGITIMNLPKSNRETNMAINLHKTLGLKDNDIVCIYQGVLNEGRGLKIMIDAVKQCSPTIKLVIIGSGTLEKELKIKAGKLIDQQLFFIPKVPLSVLPQYTAGADFGINLLEDFNLSKKMASPNKLFEYIHSDIPVLCSIGMENDKVLNQFNIGRSVELKIDSVSNGMSQMARDCKSKEQFSQLKEAKEFYSWEKQEEKLIAILANQ